MNTTDGIGFKALHSAAVGGSLEVVRYLVENGEDVNARTEGVASTALHWAARQGNLELLRYLVENGAEVNVKDSNRRDGSVLGGALWSFGDGSVFGRSGVRT